MDLNLFKNIFIGFIKENLIQMVYKPNADIVFMRKYKEGNGRTG